MEFEPTPYCCTLNLMFACVSQWVCMCLSMYCCRLMMFTFAVLSVTICTAVIGYLPDGRYLSSMLTCIAADKPLNCCPSLHKLLICTFSSTSGYVVAHRDLTVVVVELRSAVNDTRV